MNPVENPILQAKHLNRCQNIVDKMWPDLRQHHLCPYYLFFL